jgi:hypothetical protein
MVTLPLGEILPKVNPALIQRRRVQKQVEVPLILPARLMLTSGPLLLRCQWRRSRVRPRTGRAGSCARRTAAAAARPSPTARSVYTTNYARSGTRADCTARAPRCSSCAYRFAFPDDDPL